LPTLLVGISVVTSWVWSAHVAAPHRVQTAVAGREPLGDVVPHS